jgi:hypothetical protein
MGRVCSVAGYAKTKGGGIVRKVKVGSGITERTLVLYETPEEQYSYLKEHFSGRTFDFENLILKRIERIAWNELEAAKYTRGRLLKQIPRINAGHIDPEQEDFHVIRAAFSLTRDKPDTEAGYAAEWLNTIHFIRALRDRDPDMSLRMTFELGQSYGVAVMKFKWQPAALRGIPFIEGPKKKPRQDALAKLMEKTFVELSKQKGEKPTAIQVLKSLTRFDNAKIIHSVEPDCSIEWHANGKDRTTTLGRFQDRLTPIRNKFFPKYK